MVFQTLPWAACKGVKERERKDKDKKKDTVDKAEDKVRDAKKIIRTGKVADKSMKVEINELRNEKIQAHSSQRCDFVACLEK